MKPRETSFGFWRDRSAWPTLAGHVFLAEAVGMIGRAMFGEEWTGTEALTDPISPEQKEAESEERRKHLEEAKRVASIQVDNMLFGGSRRPPRKLPSRHETEQRVPYDGASLQRLRRVQQTIAEQAQNHQLLTIARPIDGGDAIPLPAAYWATERLGSRFAFCQIDPADPFAILTRANHYIFTTKDSLSETLAVVGHAQRGHRKGRPPHELTKVLAGLARLYGGDGSPPTTDAATGKPLQKKMIALRLSELGISASPSTVARAIRAIERRGAVKMPPE